MSIEVKTPEQIAVMREAGLVVARTLRVLAGAVRPGVTTAELDAVAEAEIRAAGATPSFKGYHGYPATICTSVNEEIVHGIPSPRRSLREGDIISIDCGAIVEGWHGDAAITVAIGDVPADVDHQEVRFGGDVVPPVPLELRAEPAPRVVDPLSLVRHVRRVGEVAKLMADAGLIAIVSLVSPFQADRTRAAALLPEGRFLEIFVDAPFEVCRQRDPKGLYAKAELGKIVKVVANAMQGADPFNGKYYIMGLTHRHIAAKSKEGGGYVTILRFARDAQGQ